MCFLQVRVSFFQTYWQLWSSNSHSVPWDSLVFSFMFHYCVRLLHVFMNMKCKKTSTSFWARPKPGTWSWACRMKPVWHLSEAHPSLQPLAHSRSSCAQGGFCWQSATLFAMIYFKPYRYPQLLFLNSTYSSVLRYDELFQSSICVWTRNGRSISAIYFQFGLKGTVMVEARVISPNSQIVLGICHQECPQIMFILIFWKPNWDILLFSLRYYKSVVRGMG